MERFFFAYSLSTVENLFFECRLVSSNEFHLIISMFFFLEMIDLKKDQRESKNS